MKKLLVVIALSTSLSSWATSPELRCQALLTSQGIVNSDSLFKNEISQIVNSVVPSLFEDLKIKVSWGETDNVNYLMIKKDEPTTHQNLPRIPNPSAWTNPRTFDFTVVVLGNSNKAMASSIKGYKINSYSSRGKTNYSLTVEASEESPADLLNLYIALSLAPFVNVVIFDQEISPTKFSYPDGPVSLAEPEELRAIRNFRHLRDDKSKHEEAANEIKPGIVKMLQMGTQLEYRGVLITGFSDDLDVVAYSKASSFTAEYIFSVPSGQRP